jgi:hypothetical protein
MSQKAEAARAEAKVAPVAKALAFTTGIMALFGNPTYEEEDE